MTADFWVLLAVLIITFLTCTILGFVVHPVYGVVNAIPAAMVYAWVLWSQHCLRAGNCTTLAWLTVALWILFAIGMITTMAIIVHLARKAKAAVKEAKAKQAQERRRPPPSHHRQPPPQHKPEQKQEPQSKSVTTVTLVKEQNK